MENNHETVDFKVDLYMDLWAINKFNSIQFNSNQEKMAAKIDANN